MTVPLSVITDWTLATDAPHRLSPVLPAGLGRRWLDCGTPPVPGGLRHGAPSDRRGVALHARPAAACAPGPLHVPHAPPRHRHAVRSRPRCLWGPGWTPDAGQCATGDGLQGVCVGCVLCVCVYFYVECGLALYTHNHSDTNHLLSISKQPASCFTIHSARANTIAHVTHPPCPPALPQLAPTEYQSNRTLSEEYQYVLARRAAEAVPGNMLPRPSLLLNPWAVRKTGEEGAPAIFCGDSQTLSSILCRQPTPCRSRPRLCCQQRCSTDGCPCRDSTTRHLMRIHRLCHLQAPRPAPPSAVTPSPVGRHPWPAPQHPPRHSWPKEVRAAVRCSTLRCLALSTALAAHLTSAPHTPIPFPPISPLPHPHPTYTHPIPSNPPHLTSSLQAPTSPRTRASPPWTSSPPPPPWHST